MSTVFTPQRTLIDVDQFQRMGEAGIFPPEARIELIEGELLNMPPIGTRHAYAVNALNRLLLRSACTDSFELSVQNPVILPPRSEPQPDLLLLRPPAARYLHRTPHFDDVLVLIEVSDSTLRFDRATKLPLYARHGIREVWLVDIVGRRLEAYTQPALRGYESKRVLKPDENAGTDAVPALQLPWGDALGAE